MLYRNRYYSTELGIFVSRDPIKYWGDCLNLYTYVINNPTLFQDMFGKKLCQVHTPNQNGCGAKGGTKVPGYYLFFDFTPACNAHDLCWGTCGADKAQCDSMFLHAMNDQCYQYYGISPLNNIIYTACVTLAYTYYGFVAVSQGIFDTAQKSNCKEFPDDECCPTPSPPSPPPLPSPPPYWDGIIPRM
jgi:hypothetical protein